MHWKVKNAPIHLQHKPPLIAVNFAVQDIPPWNGPMRLVPWEAMRCCRYGPPTLGEEPKDWLGSKLFPLTAGECHHPTLEPASCIYTHIYIYIYI